MQTQTASVSLIQRRLRVGYTRAGRLIDMLERRGIISGYEGSKPRRVLVDEAELDRVLSRIGPPALVRLKREACIFAPNLGLNQASKLGGGCVSKEGKCLYVS